MKYKPVIFVIDDDREVTDSLRWLLESVNYTVITFNEAEEFLKQYSPDQHGCIVSDVRMPNMTGLELQEILLKRGITVPIIFITAYADVPMAVRALKLGAVDFLTKPVNNQTLLESINKALKHDAERRKSKERLAKTEAVLNKLTPREYEIMVLIANGELNKNIAVKLNISQKTVELHRANIMRKLGVKTLAELVRLVLSCQ